MTSKFNISMAQNRRDLTPEEKAAAAKLRELWAQKQQQARTERGGKISQADAAEALGFGTQGAFNQYVNGYIPLNIKQLLNFAQFFDVSPNEIFPELAETLGRYRYEYDPANGSLELHELREGGTRYNATNIEIFTEATQFLFDVIGLDVAQHRGAQWTAGTLLKLHDLFQDPAAKNLDRKTILKLIA